LQLKNIILPMKKRSLLTACLLFLVVMSLAVSCTNPAVYIKTTTEAEAAAVVNSKARTINLGFSAWPGWFPWQVAQEQGIFKTKNTTVNLKWFDGYLESISTLAAGQIDANSQTLGDTLSSVAGGADQVVVLVNDNWEQCDFVRSGQKQAIAKNYI
jgi:NitT/TauT family transport system substrate-binding protein